MKTVSDCALCWEALGALDRAFDGITFSDSFM